MVNLLALGKDNLAIERWWVSVPPQTITSNGTVDGHIGVPDARLFHVKQVISLFSDDTSPLQLEIKRINSINDIELGPLGPLKARADLSNYLISDTATIFCLEQPRPTIRPEEFSRAAFQEEPASAWRTMMVDPLGNYYDGDNPLPIAFDGTVNVGNVRITADDNDPLGGDIHSAVRIGDGTNELAVNSDQSINVHVLSGGAAGTTRNIVNEVSEVAIGATQLVVTYTVPNGSRGVLESASVSGDSISKFQVLLNAGLLETRRLYWGNFNSQIDFKSMGSGANLAAGDVLTIVTQNNGLNAPGTFEGRLQVVEFAL